MSFFYWILVASVGCLVGKWVYQYPQKHNHIIGWVFALLLVLSPLYYEFPNTGESRVATYEDGKIIYHPYGTFCWEFPAGKCFNVPIGKAAGIISGANPLTNNPKIRSVQYKIAVKIFNPEIFYSDFKRRKLSTATSASCITYNTSATSVSYEDAKLSGEMHKIVSYWIFEFNESFSQQIGEFYNPNDEEQKRRFGILIEKYINPKIASEGLMIEFQLFTINYI